MRARAVVVVDDGGWIEVLDALELELDQLAHGLHDPASIPAPDPFAPPLLPSALPGYLAPRAYELLERMDALLAAGEMLVRVPSMAPAAPPIPRFLDTRV